MSRSERGVPNPSSFNVYSTTQSPGEPSPSTVDLATSWPISRSSSDVRSFTRPPWKVWWLLQRGGDAGRNRQTGGLFDPQPLPVGVDFEKPPPAVGVDREVQRGEPQPQQVQQPAYLIGDLG